MFKKRLVQILHNLNFVIYHYNNPSKNRVVQKKQSFGRKYAILTPGRNILSISQLQNKLFFEKKTACLYALEAPPLKRKDGFTKA